MADSSHLASLHAVPRTNDKDLFEEGEYLPSTQVETKVLALAPLETDLKYINLTTGLPSLIKYFDGPSQQRLDLSLNALAKQSTALRTWTASVDYFRTDQLSQAELAALFPLVARVGQNGLQVIQDFEQSLAKAMKEAPPHRYFTLADTVRGLENLELPLEFAHYALAKVPHWELLSNGAKPKQMETSAVKYRVRQPLQVDDESLYNTLDEYEISFPYPAPLPGQRKRKLSLPLSTNSAAINRFYVPSTYSSPASYRDLTEFAVSGKLAPVFMWALEYELPGSDTLLTQYGNPFDKGGATCAQVLGYTKAARFLTRTLGQVAQPANQATRFKCYEWLTWAGSVYLSPAGSDDFPTGAIYVRVNYELIQKSAAAVASTGLSVKSVADQILLLQKFEDEYNIVPSGSSFDDVRRKSGFAILKLRQQLDSAPPLIRQGAENLLRIDQLFHYKEYTQYELECLSDYF
ncbi:hypothetical protein H4R33_000709 [Dimargaris cristalligena]|nr:hypothetical protein H4R33_000709 [Dimargaris cristalligena]